MIYISFCIWTIFSVYICLCESIFYFYIGLWKSIFITVYRWMVERNRTRSDSRQMKKKILTVLT